MAWQNWAGVATQMMLLSLYGNAVSGHIQFNTWGRTAFIVAVSCLVIYFACFDLPLYGSAANFYSCAPNYDYFPAIDDHFPACVIDRTWTSVVIVATCLAIMEAFYTLYKGPMDRAQFDNRPKDFITVSPAHHPYGVQPNMIIPHGEPQPQKIPYQQPVYTNPHQPFQQPYPVMQPDGAIANAAMPLQRIPQQQTSYKYEDPSQSKNPNAATRINSDKCPIAGIAPIFT
ncbi:hypothetical protein BGZ73_008604 [Actinomortierella ambigua]|nr:hypothetical protein BGZ73_008604 [Actinomortierella ambigua]